MELYEWFEIDKCSTKKQIKAAFNKKVKLLHPDKNPNTDTTELMQDCYSYYETLSNEYLRKYYDLNDSIVTKEQLEKNIKYDLEQLLISIVEVIEEDYCTENIIEKMKRVIFNKIEKINLEIEYLTEDIKRIKNIQERMIPLDSFLVKSLTKKMEIINENIEILKCKQLYQEELVKAVNEFDYRIDKKETISSYFSEVEDE